MTEYVIVKPQKKLSRHWAVFRARDWRLVDKFTTEADAKMWILLHGVEIDYGAGLRRLFEVEEP